MKSIQKTELYEWLDGHFCRSTVETKAHLLKVKEFSLDYSHFCCLKILVRLGFERHKPKGFPRVGPAEQQGAFINMYGRLLNRLGADEFVYFTNAVCSEYQTKPAFFWGRTGLNPAVTTTVGRGSIYGGLNLESLDASFVESTTVGGISTAQPLSRVETCNFDERLIHVIWDNAAYHKGLYVRNFLARPDYCIHLIQLPPYCPHLNPIEKLWGIMHQFVTHNCYHSTQKQFTNAVLNFFRETIPNEWKNFQSQVSDNTKVGIHETFRILT